MPRSCEMLRRAALYALIASPAFASATVLAQSATVTMAADRTTIGAGEEFSLEIRIDAVGGTPEREQLPDLSAFRVLARQVSRPIQFSFGFGSRVQTVQASTVYSFTLQAVTPGEFRLAAPRVVIGQQTFEGNPLKITVEPKANITGSPIPTADPSLGPVPPGIADAQIFLRSVADRERAVIGEQITFSIYLYVGPNVHGQPQITREPSAEGFWIHDLMPVSSLVATEVVGGRPYEVHLIKRFGAFPLRAGTLTVGPMTIELQSNSILDLWHGSAQRLTRTSAPVAVEVSDLPADGRPEGPVAVGRFELTASLDTNQVQTGNAATLTVTLRGAGNLREVELALPSIDGLTIHDPQVRDDLGAPNNMVGGTRTFEWFIVPERSGTFTIAPLRLATFDPNARSYVMLSTGALSLEASGTAPALPGAAPTKAAPQSASTEAAPLQALAPIRSTSALLRRSRPLSKSPAFLWLLFAPPAGFFLLLGGRLGRRFWLSRRAGSATHQAARAAKKRLARACALSTAGEPGRFYAELSKSLHGLLEVRLGESALGLTHAQLRRLLLERGMQEALAEQWVSELEHAEFARFSAAAAEAVELERSAARARKLCDALDAFAPRKPEAGS